MSQRRIPVPGIKGPDGAYQLPATQAQVDEALHKVIKEASSGDPDLDNLLSKCLTILDREVRHLMLLSLDKLSKDNAHSLREHTKLIMDLKKREKELLEDMPDEDLERLAAQEQDEE